MWGNGRRQIQKASFVFSGLVSKVEIKKKKEEVKILRCVLST